MCSLLEIGTLADRSAAASTTPAKPSIRTGITFHSKRASAVSARAMITRTVKLSVLSGIMSVKGTESANAPFGGWRSRWRVAAGDSDPILLGGEAPSRGRVVLERIKVAGRRI